MSNPFPWARGGHWSDADQMPPPRGVWRKHSALWESWDNWEDAGHRWYYHYSGPEPKTEGTNVYGLPEFIFWPADVRAKLVAKQQKQT